MMKIKQKRILLQITPDILHAFQKSMLTRFNPLIAGMKREYWNRINLPSGDVEKWLVDEFVPAGDTRFLGDLLMMDPDTLFYYKFDRSEQSLEVGIMTKGDPQNLMTFCTQVKEILEAGRASFFNDWNDIEFSSEALQTIMETSMVLQPSPQEVQAARALEDENARKFLEKIKGADATSLYKLVDPKELPRLAPTVDMFEKMGLLTKDFIVQCSKTGQPILKVSSRSALEETPQGANKCFICGNPLSKETIDEIVSCSDFGRKLVDRNYWFPVRVLSALEKYGIPTAAVRVWNSENDLINLFFTKNEQSYLFMLCNRKLTLDDAYYINGYLSAYGISHALVISTEKISLIMRKHIDENNKGTAISYIDSFSDCDDMVAYFLLEREKVYVSTILESFSPLTPVRIQDLVLKRVGKDIPSLPHESFVPRRAVHEAPPQAAPPPPPPQVPPSVPQAQHQSPSPSIEDEEEKDPLLEELTSITPAQKPQAAPPPPSPPPPATQESVSFPDLFGKDDGDEPFLMEEVFPIDDSMEK
ncbi:MAG: hypothetical protein RDV48_15485 [Candidatus Eremiobacteraeota bacterium]|nr:hypothetical protein [Candidatus Eremiobacteraeota bacterium]